SAGYRRAAGPASAGAVRSERVRNRATARQPSIPTAVTTAVTITKETSVPAENRVRSAIAVASVIAHTNTPCGQILNGARQARIARWPSSTPTAKCQPTRTMFCVVSGVPCCTSPIATNSRATSRSPTRAPRERNIAPEYCPQPAHPAVGPAVVKGATPAPRPRRRGASTSGRAGREPPPRTTMEAMPANSAPTLDSSALPVPRDGIAGAAPYGAPQLEVAHALNVNENPSGPSPQLAEAVGRAAAEAAAGLNRYPDREALALRADLGAHLAAEAGIPAPEPHAVWAANGSNEIMHQLLLAYGGPGRTALGFTPHYSMYPEY